MIALARQFVAHGLWRVYLGCPLNRCPIMGPFGGAGTTGLVADRLGRDCVLIELNPAYAEMARRRIARDGGLFAAVADPAAELAGASAEAILL